MINLVGADFVITKGIREAVEEKLAFIHKLTDEEVGVVLTKEGNDARITLKTKYDGKHIILVETNSDLYVGLDILKDRLKNELSKRKTMKADQQRLESQSMREISYLIRQQEEEKQSKEEKGIIKRKVFHLKPMLEEEAVLQMEMLGHDFFVFLNADTNQTSVIYKRKDGCYGSIETQLA